MTALSYSWTTWTQNMVKYSEFIPIDIKTKTKTQRESHSSSFPIVSVIIETYGRHLTPSLPPIVMWWGLMCCGCGYCGGVSILALSAVCGAEPCQWSHSDTPRLLTGHTQYWPPAGGDILQQLPNTQCLKIKFSLYVGGNHEAGAGSEEVWKYLKTFVYL